MNKFHIIIKIKVNFYEKRMIAEWRPRILELVLGGYIIVLHGLLNGNLNDITIKDQILEQDDTLDPMDIWERHVPG